MNKNLTFLPSLKHIALVRIALIVYKNVIIHLFDRLALIDTVNKLGYFFYADIKQERWIGERKEKARNKLSTLLPASFTIQIINMLQPLVDEIYFWTRDHWYIIKLIEMNHCANSLCWKSEGTVDRPKTAKKLIRNERIVKSFGFVIACIYFLQNDVQHLWKNMTAVEKQGIFRIESNIAVLFWLRWLRENGKSRWTQCIEEYLGCDLRGTMRNYSAGNLSSRVRLSSFFTELTVSKKKIFFHRLWPEIAHFDDLRECYRQVNEAEREEVFYSSEYSKISDVLCCHLDWPLQSLFWDVVNQVTDDLDASCVKDVLYYILEEKLMWGMHEIDYLQLLKDFWDWIPDAYKLEYRWSKIFTLVHAAMSYDEEINPLPIEELLKECRAFMARLHSEF